jgi:hypothetical protein
MQDDRDLRNAILLLVQACKLHKARALTSGAVLSSLMDFPPTKWAEVTPQFVSGEIARLRPEVEALGHKEGQQIEAALNGSGAFLEALRVYASGQLQH